MGKKRTTASDADSEQTNGNRVIVSCANAEQQQELINRLTKEGFAAAMVVPATIRSHS